MTESYRQEFTVTTSAVNRFGRLKPSWIFYYCQQVAVVHCAMLEANLTAPEHQHLFWAIIRNRVVINRLPMENEVITVETWPMPTTRVAFPRATVAYDQNGQELFRSISLWVLMDRETRAMVLPGKSGVSVPGILRGIEPESPPTLNMVQLENQVSRLVGFSELDVNGHVNNTRYLDWIDDLLPSDFHRNHAPEEIVICYMSEALEGQHLKLTWGLEEGSVLRVDSYREQGDESGKKDRVFSARIRYT